MSHNSRTRPDWITGDIPTEAEFDDLDLKTFKAINGDDGGVWAPSSRIIVGGAGQQLDAPLVMNAPVNLSGGGSIIQRVITMADGNFSFLSTAGASWGFTARVTSAVTGTRTYDLEATAATGDTASFYCDSSFAGTINIRDASLTRVYVLGNNVDCDGTWVTLVYVGGWRVWQTGAAKLRRGVLAATPGSSNFVVPLGVFWILVGGCGGGGGGGAGANSVTGTDKSIKGGGGGAGAPYFLRWLPVTPGATVPIVVAQGGVPGTLLFAGSGAGGAGDSSFVNGVELIGGGYGEYYTDTTYGGGGAAAGGSAAPNALRFVQYNTAIYASGGGHGSVAYKFGSPAQGRNGGNSVNGFHGGGYGVDGGDGGSYRGGGGGGGGGAGPFVDGPHGGNGGGGDPTTAFDGAAGQSATGPGAGGGGGGGAGCQTTGVKFGGDGGYGGPGLIEIWWVK